MPGQVPYLRRQIRILDRYDLNVFTPRPDVVALAGEARARIDPVATRGENTFITGWAIDAPAGAPARSVDLKIDGRTIPTIYGPERADAAQELGSGRFRNVGFLAVFATARVLASGNHTVSARIATADGRSYYRSGTLVFETP
jgi:hypothetical protein